MANSALPSKYTSDPEHRYGHAKRATLIGALVNACLAIAKLITGILGNSHALIADGIHSFSDLLTDGLVLFATQFSNRAADIDHPYGHQRIETAATLLLALFLILAGMGISWDSIEQLFNPVTNTHGYLVFIIALCSILANELLYHYTRHVGLNIQSDLIVANAWHHRSDAASSVIVLLGLIGARLGFAHLDAIAAIIVGLMIVKMGGNLGWNSVKELIDTGLEPKQLHTINSIIQQVTGVKAIHQLRSRSMGGQILIDVHVLVDEKISVSEGHHIAQNVHHNLMQQFENIKDVTVHIDPEDDELNCPSLSLPPRRLLLEQLSNKQDLPRIEQVSKVNIHYINGKIHLEFYFEQTISTEMVEQYPAIIKQNFPDIIDVQLFQRII